jgi:cytidylate kinase
MSKPIIVAIDGPAGAGKSTVSKIVARRLDFSLVDTGAIYRCVALAAREQGVKLDDDAALEGVLNHLHISFKVEGEMNHVFIGGRDVSEAIRSPENSLAASQVSSRPGVRAHLLDLQRRLALEAEAGAILEGRDIGTVVFPDADIKVFYTASVEARAGRRLNELRERGVDATLDAVRADLEARDQRDRERPIAPLVQADDALELDTSELTFEQACQTLIALVHERQRAAD